MKLLVMEAHLQKVIKVDKAVLVTKERWRMKVARCLFSVVFQNVAFTNIHRIEYKVLNLGQLDQLSEKYGIKEFSVENLYSNKLISQNDKVKILGNGEVKGKFTFKVNAVSEKAKAAIEAAGGYNRNSWLILRNLQRRILNAFFCFTIFKSLCIREKIN